MQVVDLVRDGLNDTMPEFGEETNRGESVTDAWDFVQENVSLWCVCIHSGDRVYSSSTSEKSLHISFCVFWGKSWCAQLAINN